MFGLELPPLTPETWAVLGTLVVLEALLSADNALVLAVMVRHLPREQQTKALGYGLGGAIVLRVIGVLLASFVLQFWWLRAFGAAYLAYLALSHFLKRPHADADDAAEERRARGRGFWATVTLLNLTDLAFSVDSILAGVALVSSEFRHGQALSIVMVGGIIGLVLMRFAATLFLKLLNRYPGLDNVAYALVAWIAVKLAVETVEAARETFHWLPAVSLAPWLFWVGMGLIAVVGTALAILHHRRTATEEAQEQAEEQARVLRETEEARR